MSEEFAGGLYIGAVVGAIITSAAFGFALNYVPLKKDSIMKITKVEYSKTFNLGNYQSAKIGLEAELEQSEGQTDEATRKVLLQLVEFVEAEGSKLPRSGR